MKRRLVGCILVGLVVAVLSACGDNSEPTPSDAPLLGDFGSIAKQIATIALTPTPTEVVIGAEPAINVAQPTATASRPQPTPTMTPYVGIFLGDLNSEDGEDGEPAPTLAPYVVNPFGTTGIVGSGTSILSTSGTCSQAIAATLAQAYPAVQQTLGCPVNSGVSLQLVAQTFERGFMIWRDTKQIYALANNNQFWQMADGWAEGMPADDPAYAAPSGLSQPVRGFGLAWRSNVQVRDALGWGTRSETPFGSYWQDFESGAMFIGPDGRIYAIYPAQGQHSGAL